MLLGPPVIPFKVTVTCPLEQAPAVKTKSTAGIGVGVAVAGTGVAVAGTGVLVAGNGVAVAGNGVAVAHATVIELGVTNEGLALSLTATHHVPLVTLL